MLNKLPFPNILKEIRHHLTVHVLASCVARCSVAMVLTMPDRPLSSAIKNDFNYMCHYNAVIMSAMASQITGVSIVCSTVGSGEYQRKHQSSASLAFVRGIHRWPVSFLHKGPVTRKMVPFDNVIMAVSVRMSDILCKCISIFLH